MKLLIILSFVLSIIMYPQENKSIEIPSIFSDNMVLQQNSAAAFWGKGEPGNEISIYSGWGETAVSKVKEDSSWMIYIKTPAAGGPYEVTLTTGNSVIKYQNVLIGEVWLCSGQSNMEMPLTGWPPADTVLNSAEEIRKALYDKIRFFTVPRTFSNKEEFNCRGQWEACTPEIATNFSATAYFFGRKLYEELGVPVGLIHSSWGGTPVESWISGRYLSSVQEYDSILSDIIKSEGEFKVYKEWLDKHNIIEIENIPAEKAWSNLEFNDNKCTAVDTDDSSWREMELPALWENAGIKNFDGVVWFRKKITIPESWSGKDLVLSLGPIDDMDRTYINGLLVGSYEEQGHWRTDRIYNIPKELVTSPEIIIAVRVLDNQGGGGIYGNKEQLYIRPVNSDEGIPLSGLWKYLPVAEYREQKFYVFGFENNDFYLKPPLKIELSAYTPTALFNAMINPLIPYSLKGVIWYQGESNTGNPELYSTLFPLMIKNWRDEWKKDLSFYYVQIAPYDYGDYTPSERLRETQLKSLSVPNTGMAVTLDIGNPVNIHPSNKQEVGRRLALWALAKDYGRDIIYSGPLYKSMRTDGDKIILSFDYAEDGLVMKEREGENNFLIAGSDKKFVKASVKIDGSKLIVYNPGIKNPASVRYCWSNTAEGTLFNKAGLPASSFRTDDWIE